MSEKRLKGDKLRELILLVHLNEKYGSGNVRISRLKKTLDYSTGGIYNALDESGYFKHKGDVITLSNKGHEYIKKQWVRYFSIVNPLSYFIIIVGALLFLSWYLKVYHNAFLVFNWYQGIVVIIAGLIIRFGLMRLMFWTLRAQKKL